VRTPQAHGAAYAAYPLVDERPPEERPPWEPRTRSEVEHDVAQLRTVQRTLGASVSWIVDTLLLSEDADESEGRAEKVRESKREALEALAYVRDILLSGSTDVDEERLMSEEEFKRRKAQQEKEEQAATSREEPRSYFDKAVISVPPVSKPAAQIQGTNAPRPRTVASHSALPSSSSSFDSPRLEASKSPRASAFVATSPGPEGKAPWNYTRSTFSSPLSGFSAEVPSLAPLPRASTAMSPPTAAVQSPSSGQTATSRLHDPLGVLP
jgi:TBC1 domain family protein 5